MEDLLEITFLYVFRVNQFNSYIGCLQAICSLFITEKSAWEIRSISSANTKSLQQHLWIYCYDMYFTIFITYCVSCLEWIWRKMLLTQNRRYFECKTIFWAQSCILSPKLYFKHKTVFWVPNFTLGAKLYCEHTAVFWAPKSILNAKIDF